MANQYQTPDLQGGASKRERFFFPTDASRVAVTNGDSVPQSGVEPGVPEPADDNLSATEGVSLGLVGRLRQDATSDPTIEIRAEDLVGPGPAAGNVGDIFGGGLTVDQLLAAANRNRPAVPRFSIKRTNYDQGDDAGFAGVASSWELVDEVSASPPGRTAVPLTFGPTMATDRHGNAIVAWAFTDSGDVQPYVAVYRYAPHKAHELVHLLTIDIEAESGESGSLAFGCDLFRRGEDLYLAVAMGSAQKAAQIYLLRDTDEDTATAIFAGNDYTSPDEFGRITVAHTTGGTLVATQKTGGSRIRFGHSQDLRTWSSVSGDSAVVAFAEFIRATGKVSGPVTDVFALSSTSLFATTRTGEIWHSTDAGKNWTKQEPPTDGVRNSAGLRVPLFSISGHTSTLLAVGSNGCVLRSTDTGGTWTVIRYAIGGAADVFESGQFDATANGVSASDITTIGLRKVKMISATKAWVVGAGGAIYYTSDAGDNWTTIRNLGTRGSYVDFVVDAEASGNVMLVVGTEGVHQDSDDIADDDRATIAVLVTDAESSGSAAFTELLTPEEAGDRIASAAAITIERNANHPIPNAAASLGYVLLDTGRVLRFNGNDTAVTFTAVADLPAGALYTDIHAPDQATGGASGEVVATGVQGENAAGYLYQSTDAHTASAGAATFTGQSIPEAPLAAWMFDVDEGSVGTTHGIWRAVEAENQRRDPELLGLSDGAVLYACRNFGKGWIEIYRAERPAPGQFPRFRLAHRIPLPKSGGEPIGYAPKLAEYIDGSIVVAIGHLHWISADGGRSWMRASTDNRLPIPLNDHFINSTYPDGGESENQSLRSNRAIIEFGGGELLSVVPSGDGATIGIMRAWHWSSGGAYYRPVIQGVPLSLGVDGVRAVFQGEPQPRDQWTIRPRYLYRAGHLATDSPTAETWRSKTDDAAVVLELDAQDAAVTDTIGARTMWRGTFFGLFGSNVSRAIFRISDPSNPASFTSIDLFALPQTSLGAGVCTGPASVTTSNVVKVAGVSWTPGQWAPGPRVFFAHFFSQGVAYRILGSGEDWLEVDGEVDLTGNSVARTVSIYSDRLVWDGEGGAGPGSAGLLGSDYQFGRIIQCEIPAQATPDGFFEAGRLFVGQEVAADTDGYSFLYGARFQLISNTEQDFSKGGVSSVRHYGRTGRVWLIEYPQLTPDGVQRKFAGLLERMREPFVVMWDGSDLATSTLVQLVDAPEIPNTIGNRFMLPMALKEVV